jgi:hypothetical protein
MLPSSPVNQVANQLPGLVEPLCQAGYRNATCCPNIEYLLCGRFIKFGKVMLRASCRTSLLDHILGVVFLRSEEQVSRVDALAVVAFVQDSKPVRNRAAVHLPRNTMSVQNTFSATARTQRPVTSWLQ